MQTVHGIEVPEVIDELIEWDADEGATEYQLNRDTHQMYTITIVPRQDDAKGRLVTQHEFLHAANDNPKSRYYSTIEEHAPFWAANGVADAFVHLVYWPVGRDRQADKEAAKIALDDLRTSKKLYAEAVAKGLGAKVDRGRLYEITLRAMAILKAVGTLTQQMEGSTLILSYLSSTEMGQLNAVLDAVRREDRVQAIRLLLKIPH